MKKAAALALASTLSLAAVFSSGAASASTVSTACPGTVVTTDREFTLGYDNANGNATCLDYGPGNISGNANGNNPDPLLDSGSSHYLGAGYQFIASVSFAAISGQNAWNWTIVLPPAPAGMIWANLVLGFKSGEGQRDPDWAAFLLPDGLLTGSIGIAPTQAGGPSHINLYGQLETSVVPVPAALPLMLTGLAGLGWLARRRKSA